MSEGWGSFLLELCLRQVSPVTLGLWTRGGEPETPRRVGDDLRGHYRGCNWEGWSLSLTDKNSQLDRERS